MKELLNDGKIPLVPYTRYKGKKGTYKPWEFIYDEGKTCFICPQGCQLQHTTTDRDGKLTYRNTPKDCQNCPCWETCGANTKGQRILTTHIWRSSCARRSATWISTLRAKRPLRGSLPTPKTSMGCFLHTAESGTSFCLGEA